MIFIPLPPAWTLRIVTPLADLRYELRGLLPEVGVPTSCKGLMSGITHASIWRNRSPPSGPVGVEILTGRPIDPFTGMRAEIKRAARGLIIPGVNCAAEAQAAVR